MKQIVLLLNKFLAYVIYPFYLINKKFFSKIFKMIRTELILLELRNNNANTGKNIYIGSKSRIFIDKNSDVYIGDNVVIGDDVYIKVIGGAKLILSNNVHVNKGVRISSFDSIEIDNDTLIASYCNILDHNHKYDLKSPASPKAYDTAPIKIGKGSWLGTKVQVNKGVVIGEFCVVASNAVVTKDLSDSCVYAGIPAKKIKCLEK